MIYAKDISFIKQGKTILNPLTLTVDPGELLAIVGPNGAGKSTLLQLLTGHLHLSSGNVWYDQYPLNLMSPALLAKKRALVFQQESFPSGLTVFHYILLGRYAWNNGNPSIKDYDIVYEALAMTETLSFSDRSLHELSGGERQRVQFARALVQLIDATQNDFSGKFLFLDEHTAHLDLACQHHSFNLLKNLAQQKHLGIFIIAHDLNHVLHYADKLLVLNRCHSIAYGKPKDILTSQLITDVFQVNLQRLKMANEKEVLVLC
jgi:ABC-type hemin transport system ATPase subunit